MNPFPKRYPNLFLVLTLLLGTFLVAFPQSASAAPLHQDAATEPIPLFLGQYVVEDLENGETRDYTLTLPETTTYETQIIDEEDAVAFDLVITDPDGNELFNDVFGELALELEAGEVNLRFEAVDNAQLAFAFLGNFGDMSEDFDAPGSLPPGGIFTIEEVNEPLYAIVPVPETDYPQQVTIYFEPGDEESFYVAAESDYVGYVDAETTGESGLLRFYSQGGDVLITADPYQEGSQLVLIPFLSGPPMMLTPDEPIEDIIPVGETAVIYGLQLDAPFEDVTMTVDSTAEDIDITIVDDLYEADYWESSFGEEQLSVDVIQPGQYYVIVETYDFLEEDLVFEIALTGDLGDPLETIESGEVVLGEITVDEQDATYLFNVSEPGMLLTASLSSETEDVDFDLEAGIKLDWPLWSTFDFGSEDQLTFLAPVAGEYFIRVLGNEDSGDYGLVVDEAGMAPPIVSGEMVWDTIEEGEVTIYSLNVEEAGGLLSIALVGQEEMDLDLELSGYAENGDTLAYESGYSSTSNEIVSASIDEPGLYEVIVSAEFSDGGDYVLITQMLDPATIVGQWAVGAEASTQYGGDGFSAAQATGEPDTPVAGDYATAWAPEGTEIGLQTLELTYERSIIPGGVNIYETHNPGAVVEIAFYEPDSEEWIVVWQGEAEAPEADMRVFSPTLDQVEFATNAVQLTLDTDSVSGYNEIDAVELLGRP